MSFSPDGVLLAIGRNDDIVDLYDTRFLKQAGVLQRLYHHSDKRKASKDVYGITGLQWLDGNNAFKSQNSPSLMTGGADGEHKFFQQNYIADKAHKNRNGPSVGSGKDSRQS